MIGVQIIGTGEFLELYPDTSINVKLLNPIFADDGVIPGSYSLPFSLPLGDHSPKNETILGNPSTVQAQGTVRKYDVRLFFDDSMFKSGQLWLRKIEGNKGAADFRFGLATLAANLKKMRLKDVFNTPVVMASPHTYTKRVYVAAKTATYSGEDFTIRVNGVEYTSTTNSGLASAINVNTNAPRARAVHVGSAMFTGAGDHFYIENYDDPNDINAPLTVDIGDENTFRWAMDTEPFENDYNDPLTDWLNDYNTATPADSALRFGLVKNTQIWKEEKKLILGTFTLFTTDMVNLVNASGFKLNRPAGGSTLFAGVTMINPVNYSNTSPYLRVKYMIDTIASQLGVTVQGDFTEDPDYPEMVLYHSNCLEVPIEFVGTVKWLATRAQFNHNEFVPDMTVPDWLKTLQTRLNLGIYLDEKTGTLIIQNRDTVVNDHNYTNISEIASEPVGLDLEMLTGLTLKAKRDKDQLAIEDDIFIIGESQLTIDTEASSPVQEGNIFWGGNAYMDDPNVHQFSSIYSERPLDKTIPVVIALFKYRTSADASAIDYPALSINGVVDGKFSGANGLALKKWKSYIRFMLNRKTSNSEIGYQLRHLLEFDWRRKQRIGPQNYLVKSLDVTLTMNSIQPVKAELYTVDLGVLPS